MKKAFRIWLDISIFMFLIVFVDFLLFQTFVVYFYSMKQINMFFVSIFIFTILISVFLLGVVFKKYGFEVKTLKDYFKLYFSILWRALVFAIPVIGIIAMIFKGSIFSRFLTIIVEFLAGLPAIYWYLKSKKNLI
ncbi:hypothetical protein [Caminibacter sp.]